ncbi:MAG: nucleotidyltransferase domain-containing protein [Methylophilaceae bacterium]
MHQRTKEETIQFVSNYCTNNLGTYKPLNLYFFGSRANGIPRPESDYDFFLVVSDSSPEEVNTGGSLHSKLYDEFEAVRLKEGFYLIDLLIQRYTSFSESKLNNSTFAYQAVKGQLIF